MVPTGPGTAVANRSEPSVTEMAVLRWDLDDDDRRKLRTMLAAELESLRADDASSAAPAVHPEP